MVIFRNNNRRSNFRRNDRNYSRKGEVSKFKSNFSPNDSFQRKVPSRNNHNASRLVEKYNNLAKEAEIDSVKKDIEKVSSMNIKEKILDETKTKSEFNEINSSFKKLNKNVESIKKDTENINSNERKSK